MNTPLHTREKIQKLPKELYVLNKINPLNSAFPNQQSPFFN